MNPGTVAMYVLGGFISLLLSNLIYPWLTKPIGGKIKKAKGFILEKFESGPKTRMMWSSYGTVLMPIARGYSVTVETGEWEDTMSVSPEFYHGVSIGMPVQIDYDHRFFNKKPRIITLRT